MSLNPAQDLEFHKILHLVAAHARTGVGRFLVLEGAPPGDLDGALTLAGLTVEIQTLLGEGGNLSLAGIDEAVPLLDTSEPMSTEPGDLLALLTLARRVAAVRRRLLSAPEDLVQLHDLVSGLPDTGELVRWAAPRLGRDGRVPDDASPELKRLRSRIARTRQSVISDLEAIRRGHPAVVTDAPPTLRHERYCIPVRASARAQLPGLVLDSSGSGATAFLEPYNVVETNNALAEAMARQREEVRRILEELSAAFTAVRDDLARGADVLARLDAAQARALFGRSARGRVIVPDSGNELILVKARHPLLDQRLAALRAEVFDAGVARERDHSVVPLDFRLPEGIGTLVISGPNAGGKTIALKTIGLAVLMAYQGIPVPADEGTVIPWFDRIWCHIGDEQDVAADLSTFSGAMTATTRLLDDQSPRSLVLYDELGAGTDPLEGAALGCALLEELTRRKWLTVATTHLAAIGLSASSVQGMDNAAMDYDETRQRPTYRLRFGRPGRSRGLEIAGAVGIDDVVLERARELLGGQHLELDHWLNRLESLEAELLDERTALERRERKLCAERDRQQLEAVALEEAKAAVPVRLKEDRERLRQRAKAQLDRALATLAEATRDKSPLGKRRQQQLREKALDLPVEEIEAREDAPPEICPGLAVRLKTLGAKGVVHEVRGSRVLVSVGNKRLWVDGEELVIQDGAQPTRQASKVVVDASDSVPDELMLLGMDSEEARREIEHYLDRAFTSGRQRVRIVHGHGTGTLRRVVAEICRHHPAVRSFEHPPGNRGGTGATEVDLEQT